MASRRILKDTIVLYNYIGEVNDIATYQETKLRYCYCPTDDGVTKGIPATSDAKSVRCYLFDDKTVAVSPSGAKRSYLPYHQWKEATDKSKYWTLNDNGDDFFVKEGQTRRYGIVRFSHKTTGTRRMWHFEVDAR